MTATETEQCALTSGRSIRGRNRDATAIFALYSPARLALLFAAMLALSVTAWAQEGPDERRCTGQWRATNEERIASCTALIKSGRYQQANLAILYHDRGVAKRAKGDLAAAVSDFAEAIKPQCRLRARLCRSRQRAIDAARS